MPSSHLLLVMKLHPWTMQIGQVCMVMLCKISVGYRCWMSNKWFLDLELIVWHCWLWNFWWHNAVWKKRSLLQGWFVLVLMRLAPSNGGILVLLQDLFMQKNGIYEKQCEKTVSELITKLQGPRSITSQKFDGCIWYCVPTTLITTKIRNKVWCSFGSSQRCPLLT